MSDPLARATVTIGSTEVGEEDEKRQLWLPVFLCVLALGGEAFLVFHDLAPSARTAAVSHGAPLAVYQSGVNQIRHKTSGTISWNAPEDRSPLFREDAIATLPDSRALIRFNDGSEVEVQPESLIVLEEAPAAMDPALQGVGQGKAQPSGRIVARLVRGSVVRKKSGATPLIVKLSDRSGGPEIRFDDTKGDALFRIVRKGFGLEVVVESGSVAINGSSVVRSQQTATLEGESLRQLNVAPTQVAPPAPRLKVPQIRIGPNTRWVPQGRESPWFSLFFIRSALAEEALPESSVPNPRVKVSVDFEWEPSPGAKSYRIQVSSDSEFQQILIDQTVKEEKYEYQTQSPKQESQYFFRVAAIGESGAQGVFSSTETVTVRPQSDYRPPAPTPVPTPTQNPVVAKAPPKRKPLPPPAQPLVQKEAKPEPPKHETPKPPMPVKVRSRSPVLAKNWFFEASYGVAYQYRKFKNDTRPTSAQGSGIVPMQLDAGLSLIKPANYFYQFDLSLIPETAQPLQDGSPWNQKLKVPSLRARAAQLHSWESVFWGAGLYLANTSRIQWSGSELTSSQTILLGISLSLNSDPFTQPLLRWQVQANPIVLGSRGLDARLRVQKSLNRFSGAFLGGEGSCRITEIESGYAGALQVGILF